MHGCDTLKVQQHWALFRGPQAFQISNPQLLCTCFAPSGRSVRIAHFTRINFDRQYFFTDDFPYFHHCLIRKNWYLYEQNFYFINLMITLVESVNCLDPTG